MLSLILGYLGLALLLAGAALGLAILHYARPKRKTTRGIPRLRLPLSKPSIPRISQSYANLDRA